MQPDLFSEGGFNNITMRALGSPIEAPVSERGFDDITMRAFGSPKFPFVFLRALSF